MDDAFEDLGYSREKEDVHMPKARFVLKKRIKYTKEPLKGQEANLADYIANDLIAHGMAVEVVDRQPGEEG